MDNNELNLYLVVVGGRIPKANIEVHDVCLLVQKLKIPMIF